MNAAVVVMGLAVVLASVSAALGFAAGRRVAVCPRCRRVHKLSDR